mmetsp:Transcript_45250/g.68238  ORF Transcript_45250/g.68238 Transcript_45250/m.68238 type:complete len:257 (-) Transcript_45250:459-1229(-)
MSRNLYDDVDAMLEVSSLVYVMADLGRVHKEDKKNSEPMEDGGFLDTLPKTSKEVVDWAVKNTDVMNKKGNAKSYLNDILLRDDRVRSADATLEVFDDDFAFADEDSEVVYGIGKNPDMKRITVAFRGSTTSADWKHNFKFKSVDMETKVEAFIQNIPNVDNELAAEFKDVNLHEGFVKYLFETPGKGKDGETMEEPKFNQIMEHVRRLLNDNPDYEVWFTGHSLGELQIACYLLSLFTCERLTFCFLPFRSCTRN